MRVTIDAGILETLSTRASADVLGALIVSLVKANLAYLATHPNAPHPYEAGVVYRREPRGTELWKGIEQILRDGHGDCEDLAAYLVAWNLARGIPATVVLRWKVQRDGGRLFHVLTRVAGEYEDPSRRLGM